MRNLHSENVTHMKNFKIIAFTHHTVGVESIGQLHIQDDEVAARLEFLKQSCKLTELMYLSTCNRVEFLLITSEPAHSNFLHNFFKAFNPAWTEEQHAWAMSHAREFDNEDALEHLFNVASSLDSLVVGEREIITQVRNSYEKSRELHLSGDLIRIIIKQTIETAKRVYTETNVTLNPVSIVSLAFRRLRDLNVKLDARFIIIGSGVTNAAMSKYLKKHGFHNFVIFNRTPANALKLGEELNAPVHALTELEHYKGGFDVLLTCTGAAKSVVTPDLYTSLLNGDTSRKVVIDLAIPNDLDAAVVRQFDPQLISINTIQEIANKNLAEREKEMDSCKLIVAENIALFRQNFKTRQVELAMSEVPKRVKEIRALAMSEVFAKDMEILDSQSKETLEKILDYMEKKYISVPMKLARNILMEEIA